MERYDGILRKLIKDKSGNNIAFVIQDRENQLFQLNKELVKHYLYSRNIAGLKLTSHNHVIVREDENCDIKKIQIVPREIFIHKDEYLRLMKDWLMENKYKGIKKNVSIGRLDNGVTIVLLIDQMTKINWHKIKSINYIKYFKELIPLYFQSEENFNRYYNNFDTITSIAAFIASDNPNWIRMSYAFEIYPVDNMISSLVDYSDTEYYTGSQIAELKKLIGK